MTRVTLKAPSRTDVRYGAIGIVGGILSGLLGIGGGTVMVPLLVFWAGSRQREAHAVSLAAIVPIAIAAVLIYGGAGEVDLLAAVALLIGAIVGARIGTSVLARAPERTLKMAFGVFMLIAAVSVAVGG